MTALPAGTEDYLGGDLDRPVAMHALAFLDEGAEVTVGRLDIDSYCVLPADGAALLRRLYQGVTLRDAADWYRQAYGEPVDLAEFLAAMDELGFLAGSGPVAPPVRQVPWQRLGSATFSRPAWLAYLAVVVAGALAMIRHPDLLPVPSTCCSPVTPPVCWRWRWSGSCRWYSCTRPSTPWPAGGSGCTRGCGWAAGSTCWSPRRRWTGWW